MTITDRPYPIPNEVWQHFTGNQYLIVRISEPADNPPPCCSKIIHTDTGRDIETWYDYASQQWLHDRNECQDLMIAYRKAQGKFTWGRSLNTFMAADDRSDNGLKFWKTMEAPCKV